MTIVQPWTAQEDAILAAAYADGIPIAIINKRVLPKRSVMSVRARLEDLRAVGRVQPRRGEKISDDVEHADNDQRGKVADQCWELRGAIVALALRSGVDLGMGRERFFEACREHGLG